MKQKQILLSIVIMIALSTAYGLHEVYLKSGQAIQGYDPVAYFKEAKPVKGREAFSYNWKGAKWLFSSQENLNAFKSAPEKYAPQFGGYCAYGMSEGHKAPTDPQAWTVVNDKLYLNYNRDVQVMWKKEQQARIKQADENWPAVKLEKD